VLGASGFKYIYLFKCINKYIYIYVEKYDRIEIHKKEHRNLFYFFFTKFRLAFSRRCRMFELLSFSQNIKQQQRKSNFFPVLILV
jgi:hypothetical protein